MNALKTILRLLVSCLFWILIAFWAVFLSTSVFYFVSSGPSLVVHWYTHIDSAHAHWSAWAFLGRMLANLVITLCLYVLKQRLRVGVPQVAEPKN